MGTATDEALYRAILGLRAVREFTDDPVSPADERRLLEAARWTGSAKNLQRWSFIIVRSSEGREALARAGRFTQPIVAAPLAIALVQEPGGYEFDTGRLAQNIMLAAKALGLGSCPVTLHEEAVAAEVLGLPEGRRCRYAIAVGHPRGRPRPFAAGGRKPLEELAHVERYGVPYVAQDAATPSTDDSGSQR